MRDRKKQAERWKSVAKLLLAAALVVTAVLNYDRLTHLDIRALLAGTDSVLLAAATVIGLYFVKSVLFVIPAMLLYLSVGMAFSPWTAILLNTAGICLELTVTYALGRLLGGDAVERRLAGKKSAEKLLAWRDSGKRSVIFLLRLLPVFPLDLTGLLLGASKVAFAPYFFLSAAGVLPRVILITVLGDRIYDYIPMRILVPIGIAALVGTTIFGIVKAIIKKRTKKEGS